VIAISEEAFKEQLEDAARKLERTYEKAAELTKRWFPDTEKYIQQKRIAILSLMRMLIDVIG
jgi:hypothetical protein